MAASPGFLGGLPRAAARVTSSRFAKPVARVALAAAALIVLAIIGDLGSNRATRRPPLMIPAIASAAVRESPQPAAPPVPAEAPSGSASEALAATPPRAAAGAASPDDPVFLNAATAEDLRRLPGVGEKRAAAILAVRIRLGRFRAIEDLLKVKGIGRAMLKRLRPLVRLEPKALADGGPIEPTSPR